MRFSLNINELALIWFSQKVPFIEACFNSIYLCIEDTKVPKRQTNMEANNYRPTTGNVIYQMTAADLEGFALDIIQKIRKEDEDRRIKEQKPPTLWSRYRAAEYLGVSLQTFHNLARRGDIEIVKIGRKTMVNADDLEDKVLSGVIRKYKRH